ncbi:MAG: hypothetical protein QNJ97_05095 [Myxococcota bacterium]|nr:hypothetical protein [Myxococcota bacterium]
MRGIRIRISLLLLLMLFAFGCGSALVTDARETSATHPSDQTEAAEGIEVKGPLALSPMSPKEASALIARGDAAVVQDRYIFRGASAGLVIQEIDPTGDKIADLSVVYLPDAVTDIALKKDVAYIACGPQGVVAVDLSEPKAPASLVTLDTPGAALRLHIQGDTLAIADGPMGIVLVDISDPRAPTPRSTWRSQGYVRDVILSGTTLYAAEDRAGIIALTTDGNGQIADLAWRKHTDGQARAVFLDDSNRLYVANGPAGLLVFDVTLSNAPKALGQLSFEDMVRDVTVLPDAHRAYIANGDDGVQVVDVSNPSQMKIKGAFISDKPVNRVRQGNIHHLLVGNDSGGLLILDIKNPDNPTPAFPLSQS